jgi:hypothetical protein
MSREANIPLVLWITAAMVAHLAGGESAVQVAQVAQDRADLRAIARGVREQLHPADTTFEVLTENTEPTLDAKVAAPDKAPDDPTAKSEVDPDPAEADKTKVEPEKIKPPPVKKAEPPKVVPPPQASPPPPRPPPPPPLLPKIAPPVAAAPPAPPPPPMEPDHRIAVRQNVTKDQPDNPTANRLADQANHTDQETIARIRAHDQDDPNPTPGASKGPKSAEPGNDDHDKVADSEQHKGDEKHAPGEAAQASTTAEHNTPPSPRPGPMVDKAPPPPSAPGGKGAGARAALPSAPAAPPPSPGGAGPASPEVVSADRGTYSLDPANPGGNGKSRVAGKKRTAKSYDSPVHVGSIGLGGAGAPGGPNLNLTMAGVESVVGKEKFKTEREADGAARRSARLGSYEKNKFDRWRAAIENYEPAVKEGNQTSLNAAASPFATYLTTIHNRLHPIFAEEFLDSLESLPKSHVLNGDLVTVLEVVLSPAEGRIVGMGVVRGSGVTAFDVVSLSSVNRAQPFGKAPDVIVSPDGKVYLHWEFHRDRNDACTTRNAFPFMLKAAPPGPAPLAPFAPRKGPGATPHDDTPGGVPAPMLPLRAH